MNKEPSLDDLLANRNQAFENLYINLKSEFIGFARKFNLKEEQIIDIYQETFISFYENLLNGKIKMLTSSTKTYVFGIGKFKIYQFLRSNSKLKIIDEPVNPELSLDELTLTNQDLDEKEKLVKENFKKLSNKCQQILEFYYLQGKTLADIRDDQSYENVNVVKSLKSRCLRKLRNLVNA